MACNFVSTARFQAPCLEQQSHCSLSGCGIIKLILIYHTSHVYTGVIWAYLSVPEGLLIQQSELIVLGMCLEIILAYLFIKQDSLIKRTAQTLQMPGAVTFLSVLENSLLMQLGLPWLQKRLTCNISIANSLILAPTRFSVTITPVKCALVVLWGHIWSQKSTHSIVRREPPSFSIKLLLPTIHNKCPTETTLSGVNYRLVHRRRMRLSPHT